MCTSDHRTQTPWSASSLCAAHPSDTQCSCVHLITELKHHGQLQACVQHIHQTHNVHVFILSQNSNTIVSFKLVCGTSIRHTMFMCSSDHRTQTQWSSSSLCAAHLSDTQCSGVHLITEPKHHGQLQVVCSTSFRHTMFMCSSDHRTQTPWSASSTCAAHLSDTQCSCVHLITELKHHGQLQARVQHIYQTHHVHVFI